MNRQIFTLGTGMLLSGLFGIAHAGAAIETQPHIFGAGTLSAPSGVNALGLSPDGKTAVFDQEPWAYIMIMVSHKADGHWTTPKIAPFSGRWRDHDPAFAPNGSYVVYTSNRPDVAGGKPVSGGHLWRVARIGQGWGKPEVLPASVNFGSHIFAPSIAANSDLYFQSNDNPTHQFHIYRAAWRDGHYLKPVALHLGPEGAHEMDPGIAPDGSFIVFDANYADANKPDHLYIAYREGDGWSAPVDMGDNVDSYQPWGAHIDPNGHTLYFTSAHLQRQAHYPRSMTQARRDLKRIRAWDNGTNHIYSLDLTPWLKRHHARQKSG